MPIYCLLGSFSVVFDTVFAHESYNQAAREMPSTNMAAVTIKVYYRPPLVLTA